MRFVAPVVVAIGVMLTGQPAGGSGAPPPLRWLPATGVAPPVPGPWGGVWGLNVALSEGTGAVVWGGEGGIRARLRHPGGSWQPVERVDACGQALATGKDVHGNVLAVWRRCEAEGTSWSVVVAERSAASGSWSSPLRLSTPGRWSGWPALAVSPTGDAIAAWAETDGEFWVIQAAVRPENGRWSRAVQLSSVGANAYEAKVAINNRDQAAVGWTRDEAFASAWVAYYDGRWQPGVRLSPEAESASLNALALDGAGNVLALWSDRASVRRVQGGQWQPPMPFPWSDVGDLDVDFNSGDAIALRAEGGSLLATELTAGSTTWRTPQRIASAPSSTASSTVDVQIGESGAARALWDWQDYGGRGAIVATRRLGRDQPWEPPVELPSAGGLGGVAFAHDGAGNALVAWTPSEAPGAVQGALLDGVRPGPCTSRSRQEGRCGSACAPGRLLGPLVDERPLDVRRRRDGRG